MAQHDGKIFGIGFYKTGTTTLYDALRVLGYHTINGTSSAATRAPTTARPSSDRSTRATTGSRRSACSTRSPTTRTSTSGDRSTRCTGREVHPHGARRGPLDRQLRQVLPPPARTADAGVDVRAARQPGPRRRSRQAWLNAYRAHNAAVREFFATRGHQYFEFDPTGEGGWDRLCAFLVPPSRPAVAHANPTKPDRPWRPAWRRLKQRLGLEAREPTDGDDD